MGVKRVKKVRKRRPHNKDASSSSIRPSWVDRVTFQAVGESGNDGVIAEHEDPNDKTTTTSASATAVSAIAEPAHGDAETAQEKQEPEEADGDIQKEESSWISLICWNVLAHSYCSRSSQRNLPLEYQKVVFHPTRRKQRILDLLERFATTEADILCLQEVDMDEIGTFLRQELHWHGVETPRQKHAGSGVKLDSCIVYVNPEQWKIVQHKVVTFDDLATLSTDNSGGDDAQEEGVSNGENSDHSRSRRMTTTNLQGLQQSFLRRNVGLLVRLQDVHTQQTFCLCNTHLFWNPSFEYVKFCQIHYLMQQARNFCDTDEPFVLCGDLNSRPLGTVYRYLSQGKVDGRSVAPWNTLLRQADSSSGEGDEHDNTDTKTDNLTHQLAELKVQDDTKDEHPQMRYLLDFTLNKLCRWLRILGIDTALESEEEEKARTKQGKMILFDRCRKEGRTLVTTSTRLAQRSDCPPGTYLVSPQSLPHLEPTLVHLLLTHGVALDPTTFLTRCVVCNGKIKEVEHVHDKERILGSYDAPTDQAKGMEVYECGGCKQGYWWSDRPNSSASRVKGTTTHIFELCLQAGVPLKDENELGFFDFVDVKRQRTKGWDSSKKGSNLIQQKLDVIDWMKSPNIESPFVVLRSAYAHRSGQDFSDVGESLPFTNVTDDFVDTLDYVWYDSTKLKLQGLLWVPTSFPLLNELQLPNGHVIPSDVFPSDHLAIGAQFSLSKGSSVPFDQATVEMEANSGLNSEARVEQVLAPADVMSIMTFAQSPHNPRCDCGCVPAIPSLFEMAEMRKKARAKKKGDAK